MTIQTLRPWTNLVKLHPDVEAGALTEAVFAIDLGAIAADDPNVPVVNHDPEAFFPATYIAADLQRLLEEVLASLDGKGFARPGHVAVAVFDGEKFDARNGETLESGQIIQTVWGWIAWQIDPNQAFPIVADHDKDRVAPGGTSSESSSQKGLEGGTCLLLPDLERHREALGNVGLLADVSAPERG